MRFVNIATSDPLVLMTREMEGNIVQTPKHYEPILELDPSRVISRISDWFFGAAFKYIWRAPRKNGREDYLKAADSLRRHWVSHVERNGFKIPTPCKNLSSQDWWEIRQVIRLALSNRDNQHAVFLYEMLSLMESVNENGRWYYDISDWSHACLYVQRLSSLVAALEHVAKAFEDPGDRHYRQNMWSLEK